MRKLIVFCAIIFIAKFVSAEAENERRPHFHSTQYKTIPMENGPYEIQNSNLIALQEPFVDNDGYEYTIISKEEYPLIEQDSTGTIYNILSDPIAALSVIGSKALVLIKFLIPKVALVVLGMVILVGICAFTPFCNLTIESPFVVNIPYLDHVENFFSEAYAKYERMQLF